MKVTLFGTRGSVARAGIRTVKYGGDTSAVEVVGSDGTMLIIDAGTGLPRVEPHLEGGRIDVLLSHLHFDHIQGLGFFRPMFDPDAEVHIWGPVSTTMGLAERIARYLSPPLFPVRLRELQALHFHDVGLGTIYIGPFTIQTDLVCHPGPTIGLRVSENGKSFTYLSDHEPALGTRTFPESPEWTSGYELANGVDYLIHDTQYTDEEYDQRVGWGHSTIDQAIAFAELTEAQRLVTFHHDPEHSDSDLDQRMAEAQQRVSGDLEIVAGIDGLTIEV